MDNQHRMIRGYRDLTQDEINVMNMVKERGVGLEELLHALDAAGADGRWLAIAKTHLQQGLMAATRSVAKPDFF